MLIFRAWATCNLMCIFAANHKNNFVPVFSKVSIDHLCDSLESGKKNDYCFGKKSGKSLEF